MLLDVGSTLVGERSRLATVDAFDGDQAFVLELGQHRVDRAGARRPGAVAALADLLNELVAVQWFFAQEQQDGGAHVATATGTTAAARPSEPGTTESTPRSRTGEKIPVLPTTIASRTKGGDTWVRSAR